MFDELPMPVRWGIRFMLAGVAFYFLSLAWTFADQQLGLDKSQG